MAVNYDNSKKSVEEYFALMRSDPDHRYEYIDGYIYMMSGGTKRHSTIGGNLIRILGEHLRKSPCIVHSSDACVQISETKFVCPDVTVTCDPRDRDSSDNDDFEVIKYPSLVIETLSPSTSSADRGDKLVYYLDVPTIKEYIIVETKKARVLLYRREDLEKWTIYILGLNHEIELTSIGIRFPVSEVYEKTRFDTQNP